MAEEETTEVLGGSVELTVGAEGLLEPDPLGQKVTVLQTYQTAVVGGGSELTSLIQKCCHIDAKRVR